MRTNVRRSSAAGTTGLAPPSTAEVKPPRDPLAPEAAANELKPGPEPSPDDWSTPAMHHQMSAIWPLLWLTIPFVLLVLYGLFSGE